MWTRLIPAWAGKTRETAFLTGATTAHPRVGGENQAAAIEEQKAKGSSPRGRGKLLVTYAGEDRNRLIPAWAGKTRR